METNQKTPVRDIFLRTIAVLGLIAVLLLGAWGIIQLAVALPTLLEGGFSGLFSGGAPKETLTVTDSSSITSGQTLLVSWTHANADQSGQYAYAISYACQDGLSLKAPLPTGAYQTIPCNTAFNFVNAGGHMTMIPTASTTKPLVITVAATKLATGALTAQGSATTTVIGAAPAPVKTATPAKTTTTTKTTSSYSYSAAPVQQLYGYPDLAAQIISVTPQQGGLVAVKFQIINLGTNSAAGGWTFSATLPINGGYNFMSQPQRALNPGDKLVYTLSYSPQSSSPYGYSGSQYQYQSGTSYTGTSYYTGSSGYTCDGYSCSSNYAQPSYLGGGYGNTGASVSIVVDPQNVVWESNEQNNVVSAPAY